MTAMKTHEEMRAELTAKAAQDQDFRARLIEDPNATIGETFGIVVPDAMSIEVHENTATKAHLVLPPVAHLDTDDLESISAGHVWKRGLYSDSTYPHQHSTAQ